MIEICVNKFYKWSKSRGVKWDFYLCYLGYLILVTLILGLILMATEKFNFTDAMFLMNAAVTGSGITVVEMEEISKGGFVLIGIAEFLGNSVLLLLPSIFYRRYCYRQLVSRIQHCEPVVALEYKILYEAMGASIVVIISYLLLFHIFGILALYGALQMFPLEPELQARNYTYFENAVFLIIGAHSNGGFALSNYSLYYLYNNPLAYCIIGAVIISGSAGVPMWFRSYTKFIVSALKWSGDTTYYRSFQYLLDHPRRVTTHMYSQTQTNFLLFMRIFLNGFQYVCWLASCVTKPSAQLRYTDDTIDDPSTQTYITQSQLAGMGIFQAISTRHAGFQIIDLNNLNIGMVFVYCFMMYVSSTPVLANLYTNNEKPETNPEFTERTNEEDGDISSDSSDSEDDKTSPPKRVSRKSDPGTVSPDKPMVLEPVGRKSKEEKRASARRSSRISKISEKDKDTSYFATYGMVHILQHQFEEDMLETPYVAMPDDAAQPSKMQENLSNKERETGITERSMDEVDLELIKANDLAAREKDERDRQIQLELDRIERKRIKKEKERSFLDSPILQRKFLKEYVFRHRFFIFIAILFLSFTEDKLIGAGDGSNLWNIIFEAFSAYGNVGMSMGYPGTSYSLTGSFTFAGKWIILFLMMLGKHKTVPERKDTAIDFRFSRLRRACTMERKNKPGRPGSDRVTIEKIRESLMIGGSRLKHSE